MSDPLFQVPESVRKRNLGTMEEPISVGELTSHIKSKLESAFSEIVVVGEISNFKAHSSGHFYFSLKDPDAYLSAVMFRGANQHLKFTPKDGQKVVAFGRISVYPPRGNYQMVLNKMEPEGVGSLQLAYEQLKEKLKAKGFFEADRKRAIPKFPTKIAMVTSPTGAAVRDMLNVLSRRFAGLHVILYPVKVQGEGAAQEVATAIRQLNELFPEVDTIIAGRGGGSIEDLWAFNEEVVAQAIFDSKIPVISAVGHEVDFTIADFVADLRAPTPSAAAELVIANKLDVLTHVDHLTRRLLSIQKQIEFEAIKIDELHQRLSRVLSQKISEKNIEIERLNLRFSKCSPVSRVEKIRSRLQMSVHQLRQAPQRFVNEKQQRLKALDAQLRLLNPKAIMERGYSLVRVEKSKKLVKKASDVQMGDRLIIELSKGKLSARVS